MITQYPEPCYHLPLRELFSNIWLASSEISMAIPLKQQVRFSRNMVAVLTGDGWVLLNPVRLSERAEAELLTKGPIRHAVRLGTFHGRDDRYYVDKLGAKFWAVPGKQSYAEPTIAKEITEGGEFPIPDARVVIFKNATQAECVVLIPEYRLLVTCDSVQHYEKDPLISTLGKIVMYPMGFFTPCVIGPMWLKAVTPRNGSLRPDFERILELDFDNLVSAHGTPKLGGAKKALAKNVAKLTHL